MTAPPTPAPPPARALIPLAVAAAAAVWAYWPTLLATADRWANDPQYSHGFLVPVFAGYLLWMRRDKLAGAALRPRWWGLVVVAAGLGLLAAADYLYLPGVDTVSLLVVLFGLVAAAGGRKALVWAAPGVAFLGFMIPLPYTLQTALGGKLQQIGTVCSTFSLQTVGIPAVSEGNTILLTKDRLGVVEACSGLSMLMTFFALSTAVAILCQRSVVEKLLIVASAIPIAVAANVARITATGILYEYDERERAREIYHDAAGYLMMVFGLALLMIELHVLGKAVVPVAAPDSRDARRAGLALG